MSEGSPALTLEGVKGQKTKTGVTALQASIALAEGKAPTSIVLLRKGLNESDHYGEGDCGKFVFDDVSAAMVMQKFQNDGRPRLIGDWNHGMLRPSPTREDAAACCSFVPAIDADGNLIADDIEWTDDGREDVESGAYNYFSPAYSWAWGDDGVCRVTGLVNFALVNLAGLKGIPELMAASSALISDASKETSVDHEALYNKAKADLDAAHGRIRELESQIGKAGAATTQIAAMSMAVGLKPDASDAERTAAVSGLATLRSSLFKATGQETAEGAIAAVTGLVALRGEVASVTGQATPEGMVGALRALKVNADKAVTLEAKIKADETTALRAELDGVWEGAIKELKLPPGKRDATEASILKVSGGVVTREAIDAARTFVSMLSAQVVGSEGTPQPAAGTVALTSAERDFIVANGRDPAIAAKVKQQIADKAAARRAGA